ncbi:AEC family transporter [Parvularcula sp. LCG005]|uniref:AEC family transporter n=1 Tax=Parvularcula sp. LCG005 TaxID=3078805 RepID=UPI00294264D8|nr:AEC family transporter [Parvularcula sp. LCG005]WOI53068.1 AEC family transporter [Parvularcula sp. LCG005]
MASLELILAPLFGAIAIGAIAGAMRLFDQDHARTFSRFVFMIAMPIAVFNAMRSTPPPGPAFAGMIIGYLAGLLVTSALAFIVARRWHGATMREAGAAVFTTICGNAVFLGLPISLSLEGWSQPFLILMIFEGFFAFAIGGALVTWPEGEADAAIWRSVRDAGVRALRNPIVIAVILGMALSMTHLTLPPVLAAPFDLFGRVASPFGLFVLGLYLAILPRAGGTMPKALLIGLLPLKLVVFPAVTGGITYLLTQDARLTTVAAFFTLMPPAVSSMVLAANYHQLEREVATIVGVGTVLGLVTTTLYLAVFAA